MTDHRYRTRAVHVTAIRIPRSIDINPDQAPDRDELYAAAHQIADFLGQPTLRSEHATIRADGRLQVTVHQRPNRLANGTGSDWIVRDEYGVFTIVDDRTFRAFYETEDNPEAVAESVPLVERVLRDIEVALLPAGWKLTFDLSRVEDEYDPDAELASCYPATSQVDEMPPSEAASFTRMRVRQEAEWEREAAERNDSLHRALQAELNRDLEPELPADPTGVDCAERYESPADGA